MRLVALVCIALIFVRCEGEVGGLPSAQSGSPSSPGGATFDAGRGTEDAGRGIDDAGSSSPIDAGIVDAGAVHDAGPGDAGSSDGGNNPHDAGTAPPPMLGACDGLADAGVFENITPSGVTDSFAIAVDPVHQGTLYVGSIYQGFYKSTDCGASWVETAGQNSAVVNSGMNWTLAVDPVNPDIVYTNSGYGSPSSGLWMSTNGGTDWSEIWPPAAQPDLAAAFTYNFANVIALDPTDPMHMLLTFHEECLPPHPKTCIAESFDRGGSWVLHDGDPSWVGNEGQVVFFLGDSTTWLWGSQDNGFFRGTGSGTTWEAIPGMTTSHLQGSQLVRAADGVFYQAASDAVWRSPTGAADDWHPIANTGPILGGMATDGVNLYTSTCYFPQFCTAAEYFTSPVSDGQHWTVMPSPGLAMGGTFAFDDGHKVLYSSNGTAGVWRVRVR